MNMFTKTMIAAFTVAVAATVLTNVSWSATLEESLASVHKLYHGNNVACSAVAIEPQVLLTAAHCVNTTSDLNIRIEKTKDGRMLSFESLSVDVERKDQKSDTALLRLRDTSKAFFSTTDISDDFDPTIGTPVFAIGYPRGQELTLTEGMYTATSWLNQKPIEGNYYKTTVPITGGSSGGGLFQKVLNAEGQEEFFLVGLATATWRDVSFQSYFSTLDSVKAILPEEEMTLEETIEHINDLLPPDTNVRITE